MASDIAMQTLRLLTRRSAALAVYRHARALDLFAKRQPNVRAALEKLIEHSGEVEVNAAAVVCLALRALGHRDRSQNPLRSMPQTVVFTVRAGLAFGVPQSSVFGRSGTTMKSCGAIPMGVPAGSQGH